MPCATTLITSMVSAPCNFDIPNIINSLLAANVTSAGNSSWQDGGGIYSAGTLYVYSSTIAGNYSSQGGGIHLTGASATATSTNCILWDNVDGETWTAFDQIYLYNGGSATVTYYDIGQADFDEPIDYNMNSDPDFVDADPATPGTATTTGDYRIQSGSSVVDQGTSTDAPADDIDGDLRLAGSGYDIGANKIVL